MARSLKRTVYRGGVFATSNVGDEPHAGQHFFKNMKAKNPAKAARNGAEQTRSLDPLRTAGVKSARSATPARHPPPAVESSLFRGALQRRSAARLETALPAFFERQRTATALVNALLQRR
jgi:hypothetical protein